MKKPKIAIYYDNRFGRNDGPPLYYFEQLKKLFGKENVHHLIPGVPGVERDGPYDLHFWVDWGEDALFGAEQALKLTVPDDKGKTIYVISDAHLDNGYRYEKAKQFDCVFFNQKHYLKNYRPAKTQEAFYLPHAAEPIAYPHFEIVKKYDLCFIGHIQETHKDNGINLSRIDALDHMFKAFPNFYFGTRNPAFPEKNLFEDAAKKFCMSKVVFNISIGNDANMRFFETLVTGSFLLTNKIPELKPLEDYGFEEGNHYDTYSSLEEAVIKTNYYINNPEKREEIAERGYKQALKTGTYEARIKEICAKLNIPIKA